MTSDDRGHDRFDQAVRALHAEAVTHVSAGTMAQLHRRRHAALEAPRARGVRWRLPVAAFASLLVVELGLGLGQQALRDATPAPAPDFAAAPDPGIEEVLDDLGQSPDFYAWLASGDADLIAME